MTAEERALLLYLARWVASHEEEAAEKRNTTSNLADELRKLITIVGSRR